MFCALADRFHGWRFCDISDMTWPQIRAALRYLRHNPCPVVFMGEPASSSGLEE